MNIITASNARDGAHVIVKTPQPSGGVQFFASRASGVVGVPVSFTQTAVDATGITYSLDVSRVINAQTDQGTPALVTGAPGGLYATPVSIWITVEDLSGASPQAAVWLRGGSDKDVANEIVTTLQSILIANKPLMDIRLQQFSPQPVALVPVAVQQIVTGMTQEIKKYPAIDIEYISSEFDPFQMFPLADLERFNVAIHAFSFHNGDISQRAQMQALGRSIRDILAQSQYLEITLPSSLTITRCHVNTIETVEAFIGSGRFQASAEIGWSCEFLSPFS